MVQQGQRCSRDNGAAGVTRQTLSQRAHSRHPQTRWQQQLVSRMNFWRIEIRVLCGLLWHVRLRGCVGVFIIEDAASVTKQLSLPHRIRKFSRTYSSRASSVFDLVYWYGTPSSTTPANNPR